MGEIKLQKEVIEVLKQVSDEFDIPYLDVYRMYIAEWEMTKEAIELGNRDSYDSFAQVQLRGFGSFIVPEGKYWFVNKKRKDGEKRREE